MRIAIDLLLAEKEPGGLLFAARALLRGLAQIDQVNEYVIITTCPQDYQTLALASNFSIYAVKLRSRRGQLIQHQLLLPDILQRIRPDVLHAPAFAAPINWHGPLVITVHDLAFLKVPEQSSLYARFYWRHLLRESVNRSQHIIAISEQTRQELISYWAIEKERIHCIHNALRPALSPADIPAASIQLAQQRYGPRYLLHVGRIMPRKNVGVLIQAFDLLAERFTDLHVVLTGGVGYGSKEVVQQIETSPYRERIHMVGWVSDQDLGALYAGAQSLVFPSRHEGFGLPIVEAMAYGTPVVASPEAASVEVAGEAVMRVDCSNAALLAGAIAQMLTDGECRNRLIQLGKEQVQHFSIETCARATLSVYREAYKAKKSPSQPPTALPNHVKDATPTEVAPSVSVVIPTTRPERASQAIESLAQQQYQGKVEIIVVGLCADELRQNWPIIPVNPGRVLPPGKARNLGAHHASGDLLLFLDDDCTVAKDWIVRNVQALQQQGIGAVGARIRGKSRAFFARCTDFTNFGYHQHGHHLAVPLAAASLGVVPTVFRLVGGFDESLRYGEDEDIALCFQIQKQGYRTIYQPDIQVSHDHGRDTLKKLLNYNYEHGLASGLTTKIRYKNGSLKNRLLSSVRFPAVFFLLLPLIATAATASIVIVNIPENWDVLLYMPFIFIAKIFYEFGVFRWLLHFKPASTRLVGESLPTHLS